MATAVTALRNPVISDLKDNRRYVKVAAAPPQHAASNTRKIAL